MYKKILPSFFLSWMVAVAAAQSCLPDGLVITTQSQIDSFSVDYPNCSVIEGNLHLQGEDITNFNGLSQIVEIGGSLIIYDTKAHTLDGLEGLECIGSLIISPSRHLENLDALYKIDSLDMLDIFSNILLTDYSGLGQLQYVGMILLRELPMTSLDFFSPALSYHSMELEGLKSLKNMDGFPISSLADQAIQTIQFTRLDSLTNIEGMIGLKQVQNLNIYECYALESLDGLDSLEAAYEIRIHDNDRLTNISGLQNLSHIEDLFIGDNGVLTSVEGLEKINRIHHLTITDHPNMISLTGLHNLEVVDGDFYLVFNRLSDLTALAKLDSVNEHLIIRGNSGLKDLDGLQSLEHVGNVLYLWDNDSLQHISHLSSLNTVRSVNFYKNDMLSDISVMNKHKTLSGSLSIRENTQLYDLTGLDSLTTIGEYFTLTGPSYDIAPLHNLDTVKGKLTLDYNFNLTDVSGLQDIKYLGGLYIYGNPQLLELSGFDSLDYLGFLSVESNRVLQSLSGFENQRHVEGEVSIRWNAQLSNIDGIRNFDPETVDSLFIWANPLLSVCHNQFICDFLQTDKKARFLSNSPGCNSVEEIEIQCAIMATNQSDQNDILLYPNPVSDILYIEGMENELVGISVFDVMGKRVYSSAVSSPEVDLSDVVPGVYFIVVNTGDQISMKWILKI